MNAVAHLGTDTHPTAPAQEEDVLVRVSGLSKHFGTGGGLFTAAAAPVRAVEDVSLTVNRGEVVGVVGESGSGKSTLGRLVLRLLDPTAGRVIFEDEDITDLRGAALRGFRRRFQMIFQDPLASLNPRMTVGDALIEPMQLHFKLSRKEAAARAVELLEQVGLSASDMRRYPRSFSGGQGQRVAIARALASEPKFIVADEPVSALDVSIQAEVVTLLQRLQKDLGLAMLFISHDLSVVEVIADRVVVLYLGRVMEVAPTEALYRTPAHPYTAALLEAVPGTSRSGEPLKGEIPSPSNPPSGCVFRTRCPFALDACAADVPALRDVGPGHQKACIRDDLDL
ncbi:peptide ABC transporter, ATP-binding protein [Oceanicola granulosus HTCC2516]|uniref:Peptide ABC transporter, ATP-binding protein n=1 Tax=Oceanicola granulosus (strain ATCC BAA-861 / DSM 15982 / KCTC 12143 / HTCC2516) TaxID=314256 RepID=Q2CC36_OCEGH|nr:ABC transporter ATP-binding protein [Oceanicola granulosus]EAR50245.1 peptide ABC transporter, ATP-binding protein [Oceanicola granulosus HTCC2516]